MSISEETAEFGMTTTGKSYIYGRMRTLLLASRMKPHQQPLTQTTNVQNTTAVALWR